jgi:hypothetical protein
MPTCAVFIYRHNDRFWMFKERGRRNGGAGVFSSITAQALLGCVAILGGDFRDSDFKEGAAAVGGQMETEFSVLCEPWCDMSGDRNVEHVFACSNMRKLFCETCSGGLPVQFVIDIFLAMRSAQNDISNLRVTPADVNQALVPLQLWSMGGTSPRWHGYYAASWGGCVDMGVLRPLKQWACAYVVNGMKRMCEALQQAGLARHGAVQLVLCRAARRVKQRFSEIVMRSE